MSVLLRIRQEVSKDKSFPKLMIADDGQIVLFASQEVGIRITSNNSFSTGTISNVWIMSAFKDYNGEVTLKNE
tara:strand:+ start:187 stop:405 length:219 start_codon:yes stop_codon:yes gene_type:complete